MLTWINILHLHQPPHQDEAVVKKVADESYRLILSLLEHYPKLQLTVNITGSLIELLQTSGLDDVLDGIARFAREGRIELMATAMYHPIMPLIPVKEAERQIDLFVELFEKIFPGIPKPRGFFLPEMAYSKRVGELIARKGFSWIVLDELHAGKAVHPAMHYRIMETNLSVLFRDRRISRHFPPEAIFEYLKPESENTSLITAHDGELYGHWHRDDRGFYEKAFGQGAIRFECASDYLASLEQEEAIEPKEISWETLEEDERTGAPYALWQHPSNEIQKRMWGFAQACLETVNEHSADPNFASARRKLDRGLTSCAWWWMSRRKIGPWSPVAWHPSETKKGLDELIASVRLLVLPHDISQKIEESYNSLMELIFTTHKNRQQ